MNTTQVDPTALRSITDTVKGGKFLQVSDRNQLASSFAQAAQSIASQYVLSYPSAATTPSQLNIAVSAKVGGVSATDQSTVLNERANPGVGGGIPTVAPDKPVVGAFAGKTGLYLGAAAAFLGVLIFLAMLLYRPAGAEAERMLLRRGPGGPAASHEQQDLITGVRDRVHGLGQHRGGPGEQEGRELDQGDAEVGGERRHHRLHLAPVDPHPSYSILVRRSRIATVWPGSIPDAMAR